MSWAYIAKKTPNHNNTTSIKVKYNVDSTSNKIKKKKDNIPRHKEIIPHVADDYIMTNGSGNWVEWKPHKWDGNWVDFEKYNQLQSHKQSLPFSIQLIIEFVQQRIGYNKLMKLNYNKLQKDLKHQYKKYNRDTTKLNKIYFDYPDGSEEYKSFNLMYFGNDKSLIQKQKGTTFEGMKNITLVHYLVNEIVYGNLVRNDPILIIMKLLIKNEIINCKDVIHTTIWDGGTYTLFHMILYGAIQSKRHDQVTNNIEHFVDLIILCMRQQSDEIESLVRLYINKYKQALSHSLLGEFVHWMNFSYDPDEYHICNASQIIERLLFRGILPFQCINKLPKNTHDYYPDYDYKLLPMNEMKQCLSELFDTFKINENINDAEKVINRRPFPKNQMALTAPLLILPYLNKAKHLMIEILVQCNHCSKEIANIICDYLYINYQIFYDKQLQNNLNVQCMIFFNHLAHFGMDTVFLNNFYNVYNNEKFINYLIDNYLFTLSCVLRELLLIDFDVIISLIQIYNNNKDKKEKFPLKEEKYGIYCILQVLLQHSSFDKYYQSFMKLLIYVKQVYEAEFDINFTYQFHYDGAGKYCEYYSSRSRYNPYMPRTIMSMLLTQPSTTKTNVAKFILMEFKSEDDILIEFKNIKKRAKSF